MFSLEDYLKSKTLFNNIIAVAIFYVACILHYCKPSHTCSDELRLALHKANFGWFLMNQLKIWDMVHPPTRLTSIRKSKEVGEKMLSEHIYQMQPLCSYSAVYLFLRTWSERSCHLAATENFSESAELLHRCLVEFYIAAFMSGHYICSYKNDPMALSVLRGSPLRANTYSDHLWMPTFRSWLWGKVLLPLEKEAKVTDWEPETP